MLEALVLSFFFLSTLSEAGDGGWFFLSFSKFNEPGRGRPSL